MIALGPPMRLATEAQSEEELAPVLSTSILTVQIKKHL
jgi:hypothetical protein